jgi:RNA polymerase sigma-B factor
MASLSAHPDGSRAQRRDERGRRTIELLTAADQVTGRARQQLLDEVITANIEVARSIARRYRGRGIPLEDLEQVACLALVQAANRYRPDKADNFLSFAVPTITGEVKRHFRDHGWTVRPPRRIQEVQALLNRDPQQCAGVAESAEKIAGRLGLDPAEVTEALTAQGCFAPTSLDAPPGEDAESGLGADLVDDHYNAWSAVEARTILHTLAKELAPRDRLILYLRFVEDRTQQEIGDELGVTQMQVSRLLSRILSGMRAKLDLPTADVA